MATGKESKPKQSRQRFRRDWTFPGHVTLLLFMAVTAPWSQQAEQGIDSGNYNIKQSVEFGYRFTDVTGNQATYDTFVNLQQGPRLLDMSTTLPAVTIPSIAATNSPSNATSKSALSKGTTRTASGPDSARGSFPNSILTTQSGAKRNALAMITDTTTIPTPWPQIRHADTFLNVPHVYCINVSPFESGNKARVATDWSSCRNNRSDTCTQRLCARPYMVVSLPRSENCSFLTFSKRSTPYNHCERGLIP